MRRIRSRESEDVRREALGVSRKTDHQSFFRLTFHALRLTKEDSFH